MGLCGVIILCREEWQRGSSEITLGFLVKFCIDIYLYCLSHIWINRESVVSMI